MIKQGIVYKKGFTLIELLVATAVMGLLAVVSATVISNVLRSQNKTNAVNEVRQNGDLVIGKFERDMKQAAGVCRTSFVPPNCDGFSQSVTLTIGPDTIEWTCDPATGAFTRDTLSVISTDAVSGVQVANTGDPRDCNFAVGGNPGLDTPQIVKLDFTLEQRNTASASELEAQVPFEVTVGTRAYTTN